MKKTFKTPEGIKNSGIILMPIMPTGKKKSKASDDDDDDDDDDDEEEEEAEEEEEEEEQEKSQEAELKKFLKNAAKLNEQVNSKASKKELANVTKQVEIIRKAVEDQNQKGVDAAILSVNDSFTKMWNEVVKKREDEADAAGGGKLTREEQKKAADIARANFLKSLKNEDGEIVLGKKAKLTLKSAEIITKAPETFGYGTSFVEGTDMTVFTGREIDPTLYQRRRKRNIIFDLFDIRPIAVPTLFYLSKVEEGGAPDEENAGGAAWILCGEQKPKRSFKVTAEEVKASKVAIYGNIEDCLLNDVPSFNIWIEEDFRDELREEFNNGLLNNNPSTGDAKAPLGLKTNATQYSVTPSFNQAIPQANEIDAIIAMAASMANNRERATVVAVSPDRYYKMLVLKDNNARYLNDERIYTDARGNLWIHGILIYEADVDDIPNTHFLLLGAEQGFKIRILEDAVLETGLNGEDFREDKTSFRAYMRVLSYIPEHREASVMYDTWTNVIAAITKPAAAEPQA